MGLPFVVAKRVDGSEGGSSLGLFALTAQAVGLSTASNPVSSRCLPKRRVYEPSPSNHAIYQDMVPDLSQYFKKNYKTTLLNLDKIRRSML